MKAGTRLGPYEIISSIGEGGMGEVYRALDTRLGRNVALKVLPPLLASNDQFRLRFEREAKTISQLSHPNICTLHDIGHEGDTSYLVMELLEGESLADRVNRGPLPLADVLRIGAQVAEALDKAHRAGVVHRDVKPGNIMLTRSGAKLLDFGLAKAGGVVIFDRNAATEQKPLTAEGTILGTFQYMAPEQLEGSEADARTDIFALGAVLYEMATGKRAFEGKTRTSLIAAIVGGAPRPLREAQPLTPSAFEHVVEKCLEKDPDERWQSAYDIAQQIRWIEKHGGVDAAVPSTRKVSRLPWIVAATALVAAALIGAVHFTEEATPSPQLRFSISAPRNFDYGWFSVSPDATRVALVADPRDVEGKVLMIHDLGSDEHRILARGDQIQHPFWSPDGEWIGYFELRQLWKVRASGGPPQLVCKAGYGVGASWTTKGTIVFAPQFNSGLHTVSAEGGESRPATLLDSQRGESVHAWPFALPDGDRLFYLARTVAAESNQIYFGSLSKRSFKPLLNADALAGYLAPDLFFVRNGTLFAQQVDLEGARMIGQPRRVQESVYYSEPWAKASVSVTEPLIGYVSFEAVPMTVKAFDRSGKEFASIASDFTLEGITLSPDGQHLAYEKRDGIKGADDIWVTDLSRGVRSRLTTGRADHQNAIWSPDGSLIAFSSDQSGMYDLYVQPADGSSPARQLWKSLNDKNPNDWSPDGRELIVAITDPKTGGDLWLVPLANGAKPRPLIQSEHVEFGARYSPDGRSIAYMSNRSGQLEIYVRDLASGKTEQISVDGAFDEPEWSRDGTEVFYITRKKTLMSARVKVDDGVITASAPTPLFQLDATQFPRFGVDRQGRFVFVSVNDEHATEKVNLAFGWRSGAR